MKVSINAGHCPGLDPGAVGQTGLQEAEVTRSVALSVVNLLNYFNHETQFIQSNELSHITSLSNKFDSDMLVSIHCNAAENRQAVGTETYFYPGSMQGSLLAECIHNELVGLGLTDRGTKAAGFYVLKYTNCPAVLIELCFISNKKEEILLASPDFQTQCAEAIVRGIQKYIGE